MPVDADPVQSWHEVRREPVADCRIFTVERSIAQSPRDGAEHAFYRIQSGDWAQVIPITAAREAVLVRQYRHGAQRLTLEIPGGLVDPGEDPAATALRECFEETGYRATTAVPLGVVNPNPALFANRLYSFVAPDVVRAGRIENVSTEHTEVVLVPLDELSRLMMSGEIDHALVAGTLWRYIHQSGLR
jgi:8-oxo-dGTP pyrophosphatase MutT (NUDIX family)